MHWWRGRRVSAAARLTSDDGALKDIFAAELEMKLFKWREYRFGIVMPAAQRNLAVALLQERIDLTLAKEIFFFFACVCVIVYVSFKKERW